MPWPPGAAPAAPPPQCQALLAIRNEMQKRSQAIEAANREKARLQIACQLFRDYLATEATFLKALETDGSSCGAPPPMLQQARDAGVKTQQLVKRVCNAAASAPVLPSLAAPLLDEFDDPSWHLDPRPRVDRQRPFRSPQHGP